MILHKLYKHGVMTLSDFINQIQTGELSINDLVELASDFAYNGMSIEYISWILVKRANTELQKPLSLSDFVRPDEPKAPDFDYVKENQAAWAKLESDQKTWENWQPLFPGWDSENRPERTILTKDGWRIDHINGTSFFKMTGVLEEEITRETFIRECKRHNIPLDVDKDTK